MPGAGVLGDHSPSPHRALDGPGSTPDPRVHGPPLLPGCCRPRLTPRGAPNRRPSRWDTVLRAGGPCARWAHPHSPTGGGVRGIRIPSPLTRRSPFLPPQPDHPSHTPHGARMSTRHSRLHHAGPSSAERAQVPTARHRPGKDGPSAEPPQSPVRETATAAVPPGTLPFGPVRNSPAPARALSTPRRRESHGPRPHLPS